MTRFSYINQNLDRIKNEIKLGLISPCTLKHYGIYARYDYYRKINNSVTISAIFAAEDFKVNDRWVYKIIKNMETEI